MWITTRRSSQRMAAPFSRGSTQGWAKWAARASGVVPDGTDYQLQPHTRTTVRFYAVKTGQQSGLVGFERGLGDSAGNCEWQVIDGRLETDLVVYDQVEILNTDESGFRSWKSSETYVFLR